MSEKQALRYPLIRAFALAAWSTESNPWGSVERATDGYLAQEASRHLTPDPSHLTPP